MKNTKWLTFVVGISLLLVWYKTNFEPLVLGNSMTSYRITDLLSHPVTTLLVAAFPPAAVIALLVVNFTAAETEKMSIPGWVKKTVLVLIPAYIVSIAVMAFLCRPYLFLEDAEVQMFQDREGTIELKKSDGETITLSERQTDLVETYLGIMMRDHVKKAVSASDDHMSENQGSTYQLSWPEDGDTGEIVVGFDWMTITGNRYVVNDEAGAGISSAITRLANLY